MQNQVSLQMPPILFIALVLIVILIVVLMAKWDTKHVLLALDNTTTQKLF